MRRLMLGVVLLWAVVVGAQDAATLTVVTWNVESGEADPETIAEGMLAFEDADLWGLTEVESEDDAAVYLAAAEVARGAAFGAVLSESGGEDRLLALYNEERFEFIEADELEFVNPTGRLRSPVVVLLRDRETDVELVFMVNHLKSRTDPASLEERAQQAEELNLWTADAVELGLAVIAVGDYNLYYEVDGSGYDPAFDALTADDVYTWVEPIEVVRTQCTVDSDGCRFDSVVDFVFVAGAAQAWDAVSEIVVTPGDFPDDDRTSDHRPVVAVFEVGG